MKSDHTINTPASPTNITSLTLDEKMELLSVARNTITNHFSKTPSSKIKLSNTFPNLHAGNKVFVFLRVNGKTRKSWSAQSDNLSTAVHKATLRAITDEQYSDAIETVEVPHLRIDISVLGDYEIINNSSVNTISEVIEPGVHGLRLDHPESTGAIFLPLVATEKNRKLPALLERLCEKAELPKNCATNPQSTLQRFRTIHFIESTTSSDSATELYRGAPILLSDDISCGLVRQRLNLLSAWFLNNIQPDNSLPYLYHPSSGKYPDKDNIIRQLLTAQGIFAITHETKNKKLEKIGMLHLKELFKKYYQYDTNHKFGYFEKENKVKLGSAALGIIAILESPQPEKYSSELAALTEFLKFMQQPNGSFQTFFKPTDFDTNQRFYSGEALTAAAKLFEYTKNPEWLDFITRSFEYYQPYLTQNFMPQFVPWHTFAYTTAYFANREKKYADFVFRLNDYLIEEMLETNPDYPDQIGRFYNSNHAEWGPPHIASTAIYLEGITYAYNLAKKIGDTKRANQYLQSILLGARSLLQLQWLPDTTYYLQHPERVTGAFKRTTSSNNFRIDHVGHTANALSCVQKILCEQTR